MDYQLTQTGEQVQNILDAAPTTEQNLQSEITRSTEKDQELETAIGNEVTRAEGAEGELQTAIGNEKTRAEGAEAELQTAIGNEVTRAEGVEGGLRTDVDAINAKIPAQASSENKLATEGFVNSSVATATADFKGTYNSLEALQTAVQDANANDYAFVISTDASGNTVYNRYKYVTGTGWVFEYALNNSSFTAAQWAAINSAITAALVAKLMGLPTAASLTEQLNDIITSVANEKTRAEGAEGVLRTSIADNATAINTEKTRAQGVEGTLTTGLNNEILNRQAADTGLQQNISAEATLRTNADNALQQLINAINALIPSQASSLNQLADKAFVNSSIATNTADFKGTYNSLQELEQTVTTANANDYAFVISTDASGNTVYNRYKYVDGTGWVFEYALNNSSFTAAQWSAINSGITAALVAKLSGLPTVDALNAMFAEITGKIPSAASSTNKLVDYAQMVAALATKQNTLTFDNTPTPDSQNPVKSGGIYAAIQNLVVAIGELSVSKQDALTFDEYPAAGSDNPVKSKGIYAKLQEKQPNLVPGENLDTYPVAGSANPITSGAVKNALDLEVSERNAAIAVETSRAEAAEAAMETDIETLRQLYNALQQSAPQVIEPSDTWPVANPSRTVIYRVIDRVNTPPQYYADYMWNGTSMVLMATYNNAMDTTPKKDSTNLVTSGGVFANIGAFDISEYNKSGNTLATYADLTAALAALPSGYQKGGMSVKFVQSSDNKYVQYRYMGTDVTGSPNPFLNENNWQKAYDKLVFQELMPEWTAIKKPINIRLSNIYGITNYKAHYKFNIGCAKLFISSFISDNATRVIAIIWDKDGNVLKSITGESFVYNESNGCYEAFIDVPLAAVYYAVTYYAGGYSGDTDKMFVIEYVKREESNILPIHKVNTSNLFNPNTISDNTVIEANGSESTSSYYFSSDYIQVTPNTTYKIKNADFSDKSVRRIIQFRYDGIVLASLDNTNSFTTNNDTTTVRFSVQKVTGLLASNIGLFANAITEFSEYGFDVVSEKTLPYTQKNDNSLLVKKDVATQFDSLNSNIESLNEETAGFEQKMALLEKTSNLLNIYDSNVLIGKVSDGHGGWEDAPNYNQSALIPIEEGQQYISNNPIRNHCLYDVNKQFVALDNTQINANTTHTFPTGTAYVRLGYYHIYWTDELVFEKGSSIAKVEKPYYLNKGVGLFIGKNDLPLEELTVANSDKIAIIGDSWTDGNFNIKGKAYINKLSLFSDYVFVDFGTSGSTNLGQLQKIRNGESLFNGVPFASLRPKFAMMQNWNNDVKSMTFNQFIESLDITCRVIESLGCEPIIVTAFYNHYNPTTALQVRSGLRNYARKHNLMFWDIASYVDYLYPNTASWFPNWWGGASHPSTRVNNLESDNYEKYLSLIERPLKSLKVFRKRSSVNVNTLDDLMFTDNEHRAKLFKEINVGNNKIQDQYVDDVVNAGVSITSADDEYQQLIKKQDVSFVDYGLVSAILPYTAQNISKVRIKVDGSGISNIYVKNGLISPYPTYTTYSVFYTQPTVTPTIGAVYKCVEDNTNYTVVGTRVNNGVTHILCSPSVSQFTSSGTLTKISGTGDATLHYSYREVGYLSEAFENDTCGHWSILSVDADGYYTIPSNILPSAIDVDKLNILIEGANFTLKDVRLLYSGNGSKAFIRSLNKFATNEENSNGELLPSSRFGTAGVLDENWNITPSLGYENDVKYFPKGCISKYTVSDNTSLQCNITPSKNGNAFLEVWCRYFPDVYTDGTGNQITQDSYDYNELFVDFGSTSQKLTLRERIGTAWKIVRFPVQLYNGVENLPFKVYSNEKGIEVVYLSLKYE